MAINTHIHTHTHTHIEEAIVNLDLKILILRSVNFKNKLIEFETIRGRKRREHKERKRERNNETRKMELFDPTYKSKVIKVEKIEL